MLVFPAKPEPLCGVDTRYVRTTAGEARNSLAVVETIVGNDDEFGLLAGGHDRGRAHAKSFAHHGALFCVDKRGAAGLITFAPDFGFDTGIFPITAALDQFIMRY